jgi:hypothetical protein
MHQQNFISRFRNYYSLLVLSLLFSVLLCAQDQKPVNTKITIKPLCPNQIHTEVYYGPCKPLSGGFNNLESLSLEKQRESFEKRCNDFLETVKKNICSEAEILSPVSIECQPAATEKFKVEQSQWEKLEEDIDKTDLILFSGYMRAYGISKYKKPVALIGQVGPVDIAAYLRSKGQEGYALYDWNELNDLISLLKVRKAVQQTKLLYVTDRPGGKPTHGVKSVIPAEILEEKYGVDFKYVSFAELQDEWDRVTNDKDIQDKARQISNNLSQNAKAVHLKKDYIINDVNFYLTVKELMKKYDCNSFTVDCFEICPTKITHNKQFVPCLTHSLLKDEGFPSVCEGDLNAFLAMSVEMYLAKKSVYMGNPVFNKENNIVTIHHAVPGLKMKGLDNPDITYELQHFTEPGWGTVIQYDFSQDIGEKVTLARFNPAGTRLVVSCGTIVGGGPRSEYSCATTTVEIKLPDAAGFYKEQANTGHHLSLVYGDYTEQLKQLGEIMGFETTCIE